MRKGVKERGWSKSAVGGGLRGFTPVKSGFLKAILLAFHNSVEKSDPCEKCVSKSG